MKLLDLLLHDVVIILVLRVSRLVFWWNLALGSVLRCPPSLFLVKREVCTLIFGVCLGTLEWLLLGSIVLRALKWRRNPRLLLRSDLVGAIGVLWMWLVFGLVIGRWRRRRSGSVGITLSMNHTVIALNSYSRVGCVASIELVLILSWVVCGRDWMVLLVTLMRLPLEL